MFGDGSQVKSYETLTEDQIERTVERRTDSVDRQFLQGKLTQEQYDTEIKNIDDWAQTQYKRLPRGY